MYRYYFMAKNNIRKQKGDMITFFILTLVASALIFISASFLVGTGRVVDTNMKRINAADILVMISDDERAEAKLTEIIKGCDDLTGFESTKYLNANAKYRRKGEKNWTEYSFHIASYEDERKMQMISCPTGKLHGDQVVIPVSFSGSYKIGDVMELKIGENVYPLKVGGFNEDNIYCSPMNMGTYLIYTSEKLYNTIAFENPKKALPCKLIKTDLSKKAKNTGRDANSYCDDLFNEFNDWYIAYCRKNPDYALYSMNFLPAELMKTASLILPLIFIAIVLMFAVVMLVIAMVIIHFSVKNFIMLNMRNTGIMEASGYTIRELVMILLLQLLLVAGSGCACGITAGAASMGPAGAIILATLGLSWNQPADPLVCAFVFAGICVVVTVLTMALGREYSKTSVLSALHGGNSVTRRRRNIFSFEHTHLPLGLTLACKDTFGKFSSKIGTIFIMMVLSISTMLGFGMVDSYTRDDAALLSLAGMFDCDAVVDGSETMMNNIAAMNTVKSVYADTWYAFNYSVGNRMSSITTRAFTDTSTIVGGSILEGGWPVRANEIMLASAAADTLGATLGDTVTIKNSGKEEDFRVCGLCQTMNNMGMMAYITIEGYERVAPPVDEYDIWVNLKNGRSFAEFKEEFEDAYPDVEVTDYREAAKNTTGVVSAGMKAVALFIAALTVMIVAFVESLIVRAQITREWRNLGVSKALGFTSEQLIRQVMLSNMPAIVIGVAAGLALSPVSCASLMKSAFAIFGFRKAVFSVLPTSYILTSLIICGIAMITAALLGRRIKSLEPVKMITEE
ncbi:MAG: ABC transporter permease [Lachnospiraceae bacterium]|nr:ABC transporter permease [Lachnospiraceae bacterium]